VRELLDDEAGVDGSCLAQPSKVPEVVRDESSVLVYTVAQYLDVGTPEE
jgi:hypothetical protein